MPNPDFSTETRAISQTADAATEHVTLEHRRDFNRIPPEYRQTVRFLIRAGFFEGYGAGIDKATTLCKEHGRHRRTTA